MPTSIFGSGRIRKWMACLFVHYSTGVPSLWEKNGRWFRLYDRRTKQSVSFLSNMDYAQVSAAVVTQEFIDGIQNGYLAEVARKYPDRFFVCSMCEYIVLSWNKIIPANHTNQVLSTKGIRYPRFMQCLACRLQSSNLLYETRYLPERWVYQQGRHSRNGIVNHGGMGCCSQQIIPHTGRVWLMTIHIG